MTMQIDDRIKFPRWQIMRRDGGLIMGGYAWMDGGTDDKPDWVCAEEGEWDNELDQYVAVLVTATEFRAHPDTRVPCPIEGGCIHCGPRHWHKADGTMGHAPEEDDHVAERPTWQGWTVTPDGTWRTIEL